MGMATAVRHCFKCKTHLPPWDDRSPVREELFSVERLELHA